MPRRVTMGLLFYPRGGSAQVIRYLAAALEPQGWSTRLFCGSLGEPGQRTHAATFFPGLDLTVAGYDPALEAWREGRDPLLEPVPMHPSFEDRPDVPDRVLAAVAPEVGDHLAAAWEGLIEAAGGDAPDVLHLHHLTPLHEAFARRLPDTPLVTHLHGTELKLLDRIEREEAAGAPSWPHGAHWLARLRAAAAGSDGFIVISPADRDEAVRLLDADPDRVTVIPNGVDLSRFGRAERSPEQRRAHWRRFLVDDPQGWREGGEPGSVSYAEEDLDAFTDPETGEPATVLLFVGRFTEVKRIPLLIRAYARARGRFERPAPLVIWGGFPGEWEGEHPHTVAEAERAEGVFFAGWRGHTDLVDGLGCSDVMVMPSINESFGQVFVEAMACAVPVIAARAGGPPSFINTEPGHPSGWLVEPDSLDSLEEALVEAVNDPAARRARGESAYEQVRASYSWTALAERFTAAYEAAAVARAQRR